jgi:hypothetical protein
MWVNPAGLRGSDVVAVSKVYKMTTPRSPLDFHLAVQDCVVMRITAR